MPPRTSSAARAPRAASTRARPQPILNLDKRLVLNQWLLRLFGVQQLEQLAALLKAPDYEGYTENNTTKYLDALAGLPSRDLSLTRDVLGGYDENIVRHWKQIVERRELASGEPMYMKYFQYLALLFTEIYLDRYFHNAAALRDALTAQARYFSLSQQPADQVGDYTDADLRKLAFWQATGSGKTLLMHVNILHSPYAVQVCVSNACLRIIEPLEQLGVA